MHVVDHEPHGWFLLQDGDDLFLDVNCNHSAVGFSMLVRLTSTEVEQFHSQGRAFIESRATFLAYHAVTLWSSLNLREPYRAKAEAAIEEWQATNPGGTA